jgi:hypothetical protein
MLSRLKFEKNILGNNMAREEDSDEINDIIDSYSKDPVCNPSEILDFNSDNLNELFMSLRYVCKDLMINIHDDKGILEDITTNSPKNIDIIKVSYKHNIFLKRTRYIINIACSSNGYVKFIFKNQNFVNRDGIKYSSFISGNSKILGVFRDSIRVSENCGTELGIGIKVPVKRDWWVSDPFLKEKKVNTLCFKITTATLDEKLIKDFTEFCGLCMDLGCSVIVEMYSGVLEYLSSYCSGLDSGETMKCIDLREYTRNIMCILRFLEGTVVSTFKMKFIVFLEPGLVDLAHNHGGDIDEDVFEFYKILSDFVKKKCNYCELGYGLGCFNGERSRLFEPGFSDNSEYYSVYNDKKNYYDYVKIFLFPSRTNHVNIGFAFQKELKSQKEKEWRFNLMSVKFMVEAIYNSSSNNFCSQTASYVNTYFLQVSNGYPKETMEVSNYTRKIFRQPKKESSASLFFIGGKVDPGRFMKIYSDSFLLLENENRSTGDSDKNFSEIKGCIDKDKLYETINLKAIIFESSCINSEAKFSPEDLYTTQLISRFS